MTKISTLMYAVMPCVWFVLLAIFHEHTEKAGTWLRINPVITICLLAVGAFAALVLYFVPSIAPKNRAVISAFWVVCILLLYGALFGGAALGVHFLEALLRQMEFSLILEGIYCTVLVKSSFEIRNELRRK